MKQYILCGVLLFLLNSCELWENGKVTDPQDYNAYLQTGPSETSSKYFRLWNSKIKPDSLQLTSFGIVAGQYNSFFQATGEITYLKKAETALKKAVDIAAIGKSGYLRALARNYISQHRFKEALPLALEARKLGSGLLETQYLLFDLYMELGEFNKAEQYLDSTRNMSAFGSLIRLAKWNDHQGNLDTTIRLMEKAAKKAEQATNRATMLWSYTNLADYYGHAGRIEYSYQYYLKALSLDPQNAYAKKGIAWIAYSHEGEITEAMRILESIDDHYQSPDLYLLKAEIAEYSGDTAEYIKSMNAFFKMSENPLYGEMYNAYKIELYLNSTMQYDKAVALALRDVKNRPTPSAYALLAYSYFKAGEKDTAYKLVEDYVLGKSEEPLVLLQLAEILKDRGDLARVKQIRNSLEEAAFELGPLTRMRVDAL
ncbi:tetratricopeptide repeat protein [Muriicola sp. E247]|uniref:tetratricopeptide repeat protein n=1 Tax=Muriicola sp. E247 TaxID=3242730 RepID=UPI003526A88D